MARKRYNNQVGTLSASMTNVATSFSSAALSTLPVVASPDIVVVTIDPSNASMEIVYVTDHTTAATTATVQRAREGTTAVAHNSGATWQHGPTVLDFEDQLVDGVTLEVFNGQHRIKDGGISSAKLAANSVTSAAILNNTIVGADIANATIGSTQIAAGGVALSNLAANSVDATKIVDGSVGTLELANGAVTQQKLDPNAVVPSGCIIGYAGPTPPTGWLDCDGSAVSRTTYANLFAAIATQYGTGDGSTTFNVPDFRGRVIVGVNSATNPAGPNPALTQRTRGMQGGEERHTLLTAEMPSHTHVQNAHTHVQNSHNHTQNSHNHTQDPHHHPPNSGSHFIIFEGAAAGGLSFSNAGSQVTTTDDVTATNNAATAVNVAATATNQNATATNQNTGSDGDHENMMPYTCVRYIIKT